MSDASGFSLGDINSSAAYRLASQVVIPRLKAEVFPRQGPEPFSLRDAIYAILDDEVRSGRLTREQLNTVSRISSKGVNTTLASQTRWYTTSILKNAGEILSSDERGMFVLTEAAAKQEEEEEEEESGIPLSGSIYAYTFPSLQGSIIKVGRAAGDVEERIFRQLGTANPEAPTILKIWPEADIAAMETAIHGVLKARGKMVQAPRAKEWFRTSIAEIEAIIRFVRTDGSAQQS